MANVRNVLPLAIPTLDFHCFPEVTSVLLFVSWVVTLWTLGGFKHCGGTCCLHLHGEGNILL